MCTLRHALFRFRKTNLRAVRLTLLMVYSFTRNSHKTERMQIRCLQLIYQTGGEKEDEFKTTSFANLSQSATSSTLQSIAKKKTNLFAPIRRCDRLNYIKLRVWNVFDRRSLFSIPLDAFPSCVHTFLFCLWFVLVYAASSSTTFSDHHIALRPRDEKFTCQQPKKATATKVINTYLFVYSQPK